MYKYNIKPFPAVRVNWKWGRFMPRALKYHEQVKELRSMIWIDIESIIKLILTGLYEIEFIFMIPSSLSKKKKQERLNKPHLQTPDIDNLFKAVTDTIFYNTEYNDSAIFKINASKYWGEEDLIIIK